MLETIDLARSFGALWAVDAVSVTIARGSITGLIGPNGAGKTTLFNLIAGSVPPSRGRIVLDGTDITHEPAGTRLGRGLGRTFQIPRPFKAMTVLENLMVSAPGQRGEQPWANWLAPRAVARQERALMRRAEELLSFLDLAPLARAAAGTLSGGQRKLLELGRVLMTEPRIVLLDEPAAGVAPPLLETICARVRTLNEQGMTFLVIEHDMAVISRLCGLVHVMAEGRLLLSAPPESALADARVQEAYLGMAA